MSSTPPPVRADLEARLAALGQSMRPDSELAYIDRPSGNAAIVLVDRVVANERPDYVIFGYVECVACMSLCWLGDATANLVKVGAASPVCLHCAHDMAAKGDIPADAPSFHVQDSR